MGPAPCLLLLLMDWAISHTCSLTLICLHWVVMQLISCQIPMDSVAHCQIQTLAFSAQTWTSTVGVCNILASVTTDFSNQKASHYILGSQRWSMIEWLRSNECHSEQASGVRNILSRVMRCGNRGQEGVSKGLEIGSKVDRQGVYIYALGGVVIIRWHHLDCYSARKPFA